ncbi:reverse transcriptase domain-containing protein [Salicibibacter kimchii]|uniref:Reverse transcriptase domain-containing protein n=1 Tax=Salicibibacter kimchii TaxID=2099786 RepID=A0A345C0N7_9BACI|nr:hypothetical protein DT065_12625 [Salicibibacter kimchii]
MGNERSWFSCGRFADDAIVFCKSRRQAEKAYDQAKIILEDKLQLTMHPEKTKIVHFDDGFRFLGFDLWKDYLVLPKKRANKFKDKIRYLSRRQQGKNVEEI